MADEIQDTPAGATKVLFGALAFILLLLGAEMIVEKDGARFWLGLLWVLLGVVCSYASVFWNFVRKKLPVGTAEEINTIAKSPKWWLGIVLVGALVSIFLPLVGQLLGAVAIVAVIVLSIVAAVSFRSRNALPAPDFLALHVCRIVVVAEVLDKDLYLDIDVTVHNAEPSILSARQLDGKIRFDNMAKEFPNSPVIIHDNYPADRLPKPEFTVRLRQWMPRDFADALLSSLEKGEAVMLNFRQLTISVVRSDQPTTAYRLPIWDGIRLTRSIGVGKVVSVGTSLGIAQRLSVT